MPHGQYSNSYFQQPNTGMHVSRSPTATRSPTTPIMHPPGYMNYNNYYHTGPNPPPVTPLPPTSNQHYQFYDDAGVQPPLRSANTVPVMDDGDGPVRAVEPVPEGNDDAASIKTVGNLSQTSSERKRAEKVKPTSEVRVRGRGESPDFS